MMQSLPLEVLTHVGSFCGSHQLHSLALVNHSFYDIFNPCLYRHNVLYDHPTAASVLWAAGAGSLNTLKIAIAHGANIDTTGAHSEHMVWQAPRDEPSRGRLYATPLHVAIASGHEDIVRWLLENGARVNTPAFGLCVCNLPHDPSDIPREVWYPVHYAISHNYSDSMLRLLLQHRAIWSTIVYPVIADAIVDSNISAIDIIMQDDSFDPEYQEQFGYTAMHFVSFCEDLDAVGEITQKLVDRGVPLDKVSSHGTALTMMVREHKFKHAIALLECGADPTADPEEEHGAGLGIIDRIFDGEEEDDDEDEDDVDSDILRNRHHATEEEDDDEEEDDSDSDILENKPQINEEQRQDRRRLLELVIAGGADVNRLVGRGNPPLTRPLYWALLESKDAECVRMLLDAGARIEDAYIHADTDSEGLLRAFFDSNSGFLSFGEDVDAKKELEPYTESLKLVLERGARIDSPGFTGQSALDEACNSECPGGENWELKFLVEHATSRNVRVEFVENLLHGFGDYTNDVYWILKEFHRKLMIEKHGWIRDDGPQCLD
ncbi:Ff.00g044470.m01.CDS01 [Fusarium sp. VM40]|nr:Ff.00g044470.m01.CDS01 [Fusarium sp. VM40]